MDERGTVIVILRILVIVIVRALGCDSEGIRDVIVIVARRYVEPWGRTEELSWSSRKTRSRA